MFSKYTFSFQKIILRANGIKPASASNGKPVSQHFQVTYHPGNHLPVTLKSRALSRGGRVNSSSKKETTLFLLLHGILKFLTQDRKIIN